MNLPTLSSNYDISQKIIRINGNKKKMSSYRITFIVIDLLFDDCTYLCKMQSTDHKPCLVSKYVENKTKAYIHFIYIVAKQKCYKKSQ